MRDKMKIYVIIILSYTLYLGAASAGRRHRGRSTPTDGECEIEKLISAAEFDEMFMKRNDPKCESKGFYSYEAFIDAAKYFSKSGFATTGNITIRKRELAAFLAQTAKQTAGGDLTAPDGPEAWGYCHIKDRALDTNCKPDPQWPCAPGKRYYGRGPIQLIYNYNYGKAGKALGLNLLNNPDLVAKDPIISFKTAIWFWMTSQGKIPSCHDVIVDKWKPSDEDKAAKRIRGYGVITNIIDGGYECGHGADTEVVARIGFYHRSCGLMKINGGNENDFDCFFQTPFAYPTIGN